jgi:hypothetical protein
MSLIFGIFRLSWHDTDFDTWHHTDADTWPAQGTTHACMDVTWNHWQCDMWQV